jgi:hypothetical protein
MKWAIKYNNKTMYLDYETNNLLEARPIIRAYMRNNLDYHVHKTCLGIYEIYCEKHLWANPVGFVDL